MDALHAAARRCSIAPSVLPSPSHLQIEILGGPATWKPRFEEYFDMDAFPVEYGGKLAIPGGLFRPR